MIDATAQFQRGSRGRIGCSGGEVLERLAALSYVNRIQESHFE